MTPGQFTEDSLVQQTMADYLEQELGWESVYAYNNEDFGPDSLLGRSSDREVVLTRFLRESLVRLKPDLPDEELLVDLAEAIALVRAFLDERLASLDEVIQATGFERNAAIVACKEAANENDESRKRFEVMCREVFKKFKACINVRGVNSHRANRDVINVVYKSLQRDREKADISDIIRQLHEVVDGAIYLASRPDGTVRDRYDISKIGFDRLKREFDCSPQKKTTVQNLREAVEQRLQRLEPLSLFSDFDDTITDIKVQGGRLMLALREGGVAMVDIADPLHPERIAQLSTPGVTVNIDLGSDYLVTADGSAGIRLLRTCMPLFENGFEAGNTSNWSAMTKKENQ